MSTPPDRPAGHDQPVDVGQGQPGVGDGEAHGVGGEVGGGASVDLARLGDAQPDDRSAAEEVGGHVHRGRSSPARSPKANPGDFTRQQDGEVARGRWGPSRCLRAATSLRSTVPRHPRTRSNDMALFIHEPHVNPGRPAYRRIVTALVVGLALLAACGSSGKSSATTSTTTAPPPTTAMPPGDDMGGSIDPADASAAMLATAAFQDVESAEAAGYASSIDALGCFQDPDQGGHGRALHQPVADGRQGRHHQARGARLRDERRRRDHRARRPRVHRARSRRGPRRRRRRCSASRSTTTRPCRCGCSMRGCGRSTRPAIFQDWNPAVRLCPAGVPIFGKDLPKPTTT